MTNHFDHLESDLDDAGDTAPVSPNRFTTAIAARQFIVAGKATVTLVSVKTGRRFTYRVTRARNRETGELSPDGTCFVGVLTGQDNESAYSYLGRIAGNGVFWHGRKTPKPGDIGRDAPSAVAFSWAWQKLVSDILPDTLHVWHEGRCGRCGRKLTVPESIASGFGPECAHHVGL